MRYSAITETGASGINGDAYYVNVNEGVFVVADGASGAHDKQAAARICCEVAALFQIEDFENVDGYISKCFEEANHRLIQISQRDEHLTFGTLTMAVLRENQLYVGSVGDSPAYLLRCQEAIQLTHPLKRYDTLVKQGVMSASEAEASIMGLRPELRSVFEVFLPTIVLKLTIKQYSILPGDWLVLGSDGVFDHVSPDQMKRLVLEMDTESFGKTTLDLVKERCEAHRRDDMTLIAVEIL